MPGVRIRPLDMRRYQEEIGTDLPHLQRCLGRQLGLHPVRRGRGALSRRRASGRWSSAGSFAIGELDGEPVGMTVTLPNLNEAIAGLDGRLLPFGWARLLWRLKVRGADDRAHAADGHRQAPPGHDQGRRPGPGHDRRGQAPLPARKGYRHGELSWVLEDNRQVQAVIGATGAVPYKRYRIYEKALG